MIDERPGERVCVICGCVRYADEKPDKTGKDRLDPITRASVRVVRYEGEYPAMSDLAVTVSLTNGANAGFNGHRLLTVPICPFCGAEMSQVSLSGWRRNISEERFECFQRHRISLLPNRKGELTWT